MHEFHFLNMSKTQEVIVKYNKNRFTLLKVLLFKAPDAYL